MNYKDKILKTLTLVTLISSTTGFASDHDDGLTTLKPVNRNLTDLYVFREDNQTGLQSDGKNLIFIMNSNPRSPGGLQRFFSTSATYQFHISEIKNSDKNAQPTGAEDHIINFKFGAPAENGEQSVTMWMVNHGVKQTIAGSFRTTNLNDSLANKLHINYGNADSSKVSFFAGLREDPFFFDVDQFFKVRAGALGSAPKVGFRDPSTAVDFTIGYNVTTIVARIPITLLQTSADNAVFDVWETVVSTDEKVQVERLARPAINEGLIVSNDFLNAFNMIPPSADLSPAAAPVLNEAAKSIAAFDALDGKMDTTVGAVVAAFIPDVMRIDSRVSIPVGKTAYNADVSGDKGILTGGRKIEDDVMDITLSFLVAGDASGASVKDNVSYAGTPGNPNQGHKLLFGQSTRLGSAKFPFLATPN